MPGQRETGAGGAGSSQDAGVGGTPRVPQSWRPRLIAELPDSGLREKTPHHAPHGAKRGPAEGPINMPRCNPRVGERNPIEVSTGNEVGET